MPDCECIVGCPFFNDKMKDQQGIAAMYKTMFCQDDYLKCARYMVFKKLGKSNVPADLYPNMIDRAKKLIEGK